MLTVRLNWTGWYSASIDGSPVEHEDDCPLRACYMAICAERRRRRAENRY